MSLFSLFIQTLYKSRETAREIMMLPSAKLKLALILLFPLHILSLGFANIDVVKQVEHVPELAFYFLAAALLAALYFNGFLALFFRRKVTFLKLVVIHYFSAAPMILAAIIVAIIWIIRLVLINHTFSTIGLMWFWFVVAFILTIFWVWGFALQIIMLSEVTGKKSGKIFVLMLLSSICSFFAVGLCLATFSPFSPLFT